MLNLVDGGIYFSKRRIWSAKQLEQITLPGVQGQYVLILRCQHPEQTSCIYDVFVNTIEVLRKVRFLGSDTKRWSGSLILFDFRFPLGLAWHRYLL